MEGAADRAPLVGFPAQAKRGRVLALEAYAVLRAAFRPGGRDEQGYGVPSREERAQLVEVREGRFEGVPGCYIGPFVEPVERPQRDDRGIDDPHAAERADDGLKGVVVLYQLVDAGLAPSVRLGDAVAGLDPEGAPAFADEDEAPHHRGKRSAAEAGSVGGGGNGAPERLPVVSALIDERVAGFFQLGGQVDDGAPDLEFRHGLGSGVMILRFEATPPSGRVERQHPAVAMGFHEYIMGHADFGKRMAGADGANLQSVFGRDAADRLEMGEGEGLEDLERFDFLKSQVADPFPVECLRDAQRLQRGALFLPDVADGLPLLLLRVRDPVLLHVDRGVLRVLPVLLRDLDDVFLFLADVLLRLALLLALHVRLADLLHRAAFLLARILLHDLGLLTRVLLYRARILSRILLLFARFLTGVLLVCAGFFLPGLDLAFAVLLE